MDPFTLQLLLLVGNLTATPLLMPTPSAATITPHAATSAPVTPLAAGSTYEAPPRRSPPTIIIRTPVGRQFFVLGFQSSYWLGTGSISALDGNGGVAEPVGDFTDHGVGIGPLYIGLLHVVTNRVLFEGRVGMGALWFANDRLLSNDLSAEGEPHLGLQINAEIRARTVTPGGLTGSLGRNLLRASLPDSSGGLLGVSPTVGYFSWDEGYSGFWLVEVGYSYPLINGMTPEFNDVGSEHPIDSTWQQFTLSFEIGY